MSLHMLRELASMTITVYGLPEHCGTDDKLQELAESAEELLHYLDYERMLLQRVKHSFPELADKIEITVKGP